MVIKVAGKNNAYQSLVGCGKIIAVMLASVLFLALPSDAGPRKEKLLQRARNVMEKSITITNRANATVQNAFHL